MHSDAEASRIKACIVCVNFLWTECDANKSGRQQVASSSSAMWSDIDYIVEYITQKQRDSKSCPRDDSHPLISSHGEEAGAAASDDDDDLDSKPFEVSSQQFSLRMQNWWLKRVKIGRFRTGDVITYKSFKCSITAKYELQDHASSAIFRDPIAWALNGREKTLKTPALAGTMRSIFHEDDRHMVNSRHRVLSLACARNLRTAMQFLSGDGGTGHVRKCRPRIEPNNDSPIGSGHETRTKRRDVGESSYSGREKLPRLCSEGRGADGNGRGSTPPTPPPEKHLVITIRSESMKKSEDVQLRIKRYKPISKYLDHYNSLYPVTADQARVFYAGPRVIMPEETADEQQLTGADVLQAHVISGLGRKW